MKLLTAHPLDSFPAELRGGVVTVGNFDGVHRGHAELLRAAVGRAREKHVPAVALTFEPHPRTFFKPAEPVFRLSPLPAKTRLVTALGLDGFMVATFNRAFANHTPQAFVEETLAGRLNAVAVIIGHDFRYGKGRAGTSETLVADGTRLGIAVEEVGKVKDESGAAVSSSAIRDALAGGMIADASRLLGHRWFVEGEVIAGDRRGRELGFPTANMLVGPDCRLRQGVYAVLVELPSGEIHRGIASYGRPMFGNDAQLLESYLFDFDGDLYGKKIVVTFLDWIRPQERFPSIEGLIAAMNRDAAAARAMIDRARPGSPLDQALARVV